MHPKLPITVYRSLHPASLNMVFGAKNEDFVGIPQSYNLFYFRVRKALFHRKFLSIFLTMQEVQLKIKIIKNLK